MKIRFFLLAFVFVGCSEKLTLAKELACNNFPSFTSTITKSDFNNKFSIEIPNSWKHKGYFDDYQSSVFAADTVKELTDSYVLDVAYKYSTIQIDDSFQTKINKSNTLDVLKNNIETYKDSPSYWQVSKGVKNGYVLHEFHQFIQDGSEGFIEIKTEFYGEDLVDERLCEALRIINTIELN